MEEAESGHGKLTPVDQAWTGPRFLILLAVTLTVAMAILFVVASLGKNDWAPPWLAHDPVEHVVTSSQLGVDLLPSADGEDGESEAATPPPEPAEEPATAPAQAPAEH